MWTITPGGRPDTYPDEYRIQMTTVHSPLSLNPDGPTLLMGYYPDLRVFTGFRIESHLQFRQGSNSCQISLETLRNAHNFGWGFYTNQHHETVSAFRPDQFLNYAFNAGAIHTQKSGAVELLNKITRPGPVPQEEIHQASDERRRVLEEVSRWVREANFRDQVLTAYRNQCAITGVQLRLLDAAHILPVGASGSADVVTNALCLSPTYHRAYDHGLIYLSEDLYMRINQPKLALLRADNLLGGLDHFRQPLERRIFLPPNTAEHPSAHFIRQANRFRAIRP